MTPCAGKCCAISRRIATSAARSASVTGSNAPPRDLSSAPIALRKNGRITSAEICASRSTKPEKSMAVMRRAPAEFAYVAYRFGQARPERRFEINHINSCSVGKFVARGPPPIGAPSVLDPWRKKVFPPAGKITLAFGAAQFDIVAVRHDLPHMPSLGVSSLDLGRLWRYRRPPFFQAFQASSMQPRTLAQRRRLSVIPPPLAGGRSRARCAGSGSRRRFEDGRRVPASTPISPLSARPCKGRG